MKKYITMVVICSFLSMVPGVQQSWARGFFGAPPEETPSVINYGWRGLALGSMAGLAAGYARYADSDDNTNDILKSVAFGALSGTGFGLLVGFGDVASGKAGIGGIILRDMHLGGLLGLTVGTVWGGIKAIDDEKWETVGKGAAWGYLGGLVVGLGIAIIEGPSIVAEQRTTTTQVRHGLALFEDSRQDLCPGWQVSCNF